MDIESGAVESVTKSDILGLATWDQQRTTEQLLGFIARREAVVADMQQEEY